MCAAAAHSLAGDSKLSSWIMFGTNSICAPYMPKTAEPVLMKSEGEMPKMIHEDNFESPANECAAATHMHSCRGVRSPRAIPYARAKASDARANTVRRHTRCLLYTSPSPRDS